MPAPDPPEFRRRAVELARQGERPLAELAKQLQISEANPVSGMPTRSTTSRSTSVTPSHGLIASRCGGCDEDDHGADGDSDGESELNE